MTTNTQKKRIHWKELDILRGLAALLMIVNHAGYQKLAPTETNGLVASSLLFISSFAPVLFFFVTGVGYGLQSIQKKNASHWYVILNKVIILFLADFLIHWSNGRWIGLEFLGFIGLSSLVMEFVRKSKSPVFYCLIGFVAISLLRYLLGPYVHSLGYPKQASWLINWILGIKDTPGVSYSLSPWLAYPFGGYITGVAAMHYRRFIETQRFKVVSGLLILGLIPTIAALFLAQPGGSFFRWGTVGIGFYVASFAVLLISLTISLALCGNSINQGFQENLSSKGIASLAVVPIHYFLIYLVVANGGTEVDLFRYSLIALAVLIASFLLSRAVENLSTKIRQLNKPRVVWFGLVGRFLLAGTITWIRSKGATSLAILPRTFGQVVLCLLFGVRLPL
jgi:uncharacterized membrane protein